MILAKTTRLRPTKGGIGHGLDRRLDQNILLVRQAAGLKLWTLSGGKMKREVYGETALRVQIGSRLRVLDRRDKDPIALLFAAIPNKPSIKVKQKEKEIKSEF
ncbi:MAG: hypothetical protein JO334_12450 [Verrucomicrobia bacterium]|nr:hypothetical protein [Verrucomicrobiota bacterium]